MKLTPKEKAKELFSKYQNIYITEDSMGIDDELAKQCALIAVDEIISIKILWFPKVYIFSIFLKP